MKVYSLNLKKVNPKDIAEGTHRFAVVKALQKLKEATSADVVGFVKKNRLLRKSEMDPTKAIHWMITKMAKDGELKARPFQPAAKKAA